ncbi:hypothetical protein MUN74_04135 [Agromyces endophyticus]|nr:hypothetical protein [Agromyces sp. H17E-10]UOQ90112.1 hypothetical protein MUN74_04135 [Agromyces sp. H17E-10]
MAVAKGGRGAGDAGDAVDDERGDRFRRHRERRSARLAIDRDGLTGDEGVRRGGVGRIGLRRRDGGHARIRGDLTEVGQVERDLLRRGGRVAVHDRRARSVASHRRRARRIVDGDEVVAFVDVLREVADRVELRVDRDAALGHRGRVAARVGHASLRLPHRLAALRVRLAVEVDEDRSPVEVLALRLHVVEVFDGLPEHPRLRLELAQVVLDAAGDAESVLHAERVPRAAPVALDLAHPEVGVGLLGEIAHDEPARRAVGVHVHACDRVAGLLRVGGPVGREDARVRLVHRGDTGIGRRAGLGELGVDGVHELRLPHGADVHALLPAADGYAVLQSRAPVVRIRLVEGVDRVDLDTVLVLEALGDVDEIARERRDRGGLQLLGRRVEAAGHVSALGHEVRRRVGERLPVRDAVVGGEPLDPPSLGRVGLPVVRRGVVGVPGGEQCVPIGEVGRDAAVGAGVAVGVLRPPAVDRAAGTQVVADIARVAAPDVVARDVQVEAVFAEHRLVQLLAQFIGVAAGRVGEPDEARTPAFERLARVRGIRGDGRAVRRFGRSRRERYDQCAGERAGRDERGDSSSA